MGEGSETDTGGSLLNEFHGVFDLEESNFGGPDGYICVVLVTEPDESVFV